MRCGDWVVNNGEVCDDGNNTNWDGCSSNCFSETVTPTPVPVVTPPVPVEVEVIVEVPPIEVEVPEIEIPFIPQPQQPLVATPEPLTLPDRLPDTWVVDWGLQHSTVTLMTLILRKEEELS